MQSHWELDIKTCILWTLNWLLIGLLRHVTSHLLDPHWHIFKILVSKCEQIVCPAQLREHSAAYINTRLKTATHTRTTTYTPIQWPQCRPLPPTPAKHAARPLKRSLTLVSVILWGRSRLRSHTEMTCSLASSTATSCCPPSCWQT